MRMIVWTVALVVGLSISGNGFADDRTKTSASDLKKQAEQTLETAKKFTAEQKEIYQRKAEAELRELGLSIAELKKKSEVVRGEALEQLESKLKELKEKQKVAEKKLSELRSAGAQAWEDAKTGLENAVAALKSSYENIVKQLK